MSSARVAPATARVDGTCPTCKGKIEIVGRGRDGAEIRRCSSCGRTPGVTPPPAATSPTSPAATLPTSSSTSARSCTTSGCLGVLDAQGSCSRCEKRARWIEANRPKRDCEICGADISGVLHAIKLCVACRTAKQRTSVKVSAAKAKER